MWSCRNSQINWTRGHIALSAVFTQYTPDCCLTPRSVWFCFELRSKNLFSEQWSVGNVIALIVYTPDCWLTLTPHQNLHSKVILFIPRLKWKASIRFEMYTFNNESILYKLIKTLPQMPTTVQLHLSDFFPAWCHHTLWLQNLSFVQTWNQFSGPPPVYPARLWVTN